MWKRVTTDIDAVCAELHAKEAETIKALQLRTHIWEPTPFPVELPPTERISRSAEPAFTTTPWVPRPPWLWQELPTEPGDARFAKGTHWREGTGLLLAALSREEAEQRHRDREDYVMVVRLADGLLLKIAFSGWDRNNPEIHTYVSTWSPRASLHIELHGASRFVATRTSPDWDRSGVVELWSIDVYEWHPRRSIWHCFISLEN